MRIVVAALSVALLSWLALALLGCVADTNEEGTGKVYPQETGGSTQPSTVDDSGRLESYLNANVLVHDYDGSLRTCPASEYSVTIVFVDGAKKVRDRARDDSLNFAHISQFVLLHRSGEKYALAPNEVAGATKTVVFNRPCRLYLGLYALLDPRLEDDNLRVTITQIGGPTWWQTDGQQPTVRRSLSPSNIVLLIDDLPWGATFRVSLTRQGIEISANQVSLDPGESFCLPLGLDSRFTKSGMVPVVGCIVDAKNHRPVVSNTVVRTVRRELFSQVMVERDLAEPPMSKDGGFSFLLSSPREVHLLIDARANGYVYNELAIRPTIAQVNGSDVMNLGVIALSKGKEFSITVSDRSGRVIPESSAWLEVDGIEYAREAYSSQRGLIPMANVPLKGIAKLYVSADGYRGRVVNVNLSRPNDVTVSLDKQNTYTIKYGIEGVENGAKSRIYAVQFSSLEDAVVWSHTFIDRDQAGQLTIESHPSLETLAIYVDCPDLKVAIEPQFVERAQLEDGLVELQFYLHEAREIRMPFMPGESAFSVLVDRSRDLVFTKQVSCTSDGPPSILYLPDQVIDRTDLVTFPLREKDSHLRKRIALREYLDE